MARDCSLNSPKNLQVQNKLCTNIVLNVKTKTRHVMNSYFLGNSMNNVLSYCGLTDASEKDLPVTLVIDQKEIV